jgi:hypothetical protein
MTGEELAVRAGITVGGLTMGEMLWGGMAKEREGGVRKG